jgi:hypothetical protein
MSGTARLSALIFGLLNDRMGVSMRGGYTVREAELRCLVVV